ncbi:hypothetical protein DFH09DRAFT_1290297 [Mycena vulgaris]|nr:hypothetical protein DFH09DRAFT_1290297 [Mycena vulgaris]
MARGQVWGDGPVASPAVAEVVLIRDNHSKAFSLARHEYGKSPESEKSAVDVTAPVLIATLLSVPPSLDPPYPLIDSPYPSADHLPVPPAVRFLVPHVSFHRPVHLVIVANNPRTLLARLPAPFIYDYLFAVTAGPYGPFSFPLNCHHVSSSAYDVVLALDLTAYLCDSLVHSGYRPDSNFSSWSFFSPYLPSTASGPLPPATLTSHLSVFRGVSASSRASQPHVSSRIAFPIDSSSWAPVADGSSGVPSVHAPSSSSLFVVPPVDPSSSQRCSPPLSLDPSDLFSATFLLPREDLNMFNMSGESLFT